MTAQVLDGRATAREVADDVRAQVQVILQSGDPQPAIAVVRVGDDPASVRYAGQIERAFRSAGMGFQLEVLPDSVGPAELERLVLSLGADEAVHGILVQFPLPSHLSRELAADAIAPIKDVDGVSPVNAGGLFLGRRRCFAPATPLGGIELLRRRGFQIAGRHAVVVGRSDIVGRPLAMLFLQENATVTICHSRTPDLTRFTRQAEILAAATGKPGLIDGDMVAPGAVVLDFGMNLVDGKLVGDVDFAAVAAVAAAVTPVPGGTGPMTNAMLLANTLEAYRRQREPYDENETQSPRLPDARSNPTRKRGR